MLVNSLDKKYNTLVKLDKIELKQKYLKENLSDEEFVYVGDDVNDFDSLNRAKYAVTVPTAVEKVKKILHIQITHAESGMGAFREVVDSLL